MPNINSPTIIHTASLLAPDFFFVAIGVIPLIQFQNA
jgi:hypothetical protein